jgi:hypothetical protein
MQTYKPWKAEVSELSKERGLPKTATATNVKRGGLSAASAYINGYSPDKFVRHLDGEPLIHQEMSRANVSSQPMGADSTLAELLSPHTDPDGVIRKKIRVDRYWSARHKTRVLVTFIDGRTAETVANPEKALASLIQLAKHLRVISSIRISNVVRDPAEFRANREAIVATFYN